jgi:RNA polymerase sigma-70 factor (ECF subfamily)
MCATRPSPEAAEAEPGAVQVTRWSLVARLHDTDRETQLRALETLVQTYQPVLEWYLRRHPGLDPHQREDLVQGFLASKVIEQSIMTRADQSRGRFRTFLLNAFQNYVRDELRRASAARRMPAAGPPLALDEADGVADGGSDMDREFQQEWVRQVIMLAVTAMQQECASKERQDVWAVFESRLLCPILEGATPEPYGDLVARLGLASPTQASNLLVTGKRMFSRHLHDVVQDTVEDPLQADAELQELKKCL